MTSIFVVLADDTRREILEVLRAYSATNLTGEGVSVGELVERLGVSQPTVSKHLKVLREAGLVAVREDGQRRLYSIDPAPINEVAKWAAPFIATNVASSVSRAAVSTVDAAAQGLDDIVGDGTADKVAASIGEFAANVAHVFTTASDKVKETVVDPIKSKFDHSSSER